MDPTLPTRPLPREDLPKGRSDAVAAGWGWSNPRPDRHGLSPTLSESGERQISFVFLSY